MDQSLLRHLTGSHYTFEYLRGREGGGYWDDNLRGRGRSNRSLTSLVNSQALSSPRGEAEASSPLQTNYTLKFDAKMAKAPRVHI